MNIIKSFLQQKLRNIRNKNVPKDEKERQTQPAVTKLKEWSTIEQVSTDPTCNEFPVIIRHRDINSENAAVWYGVQQQYHSFDRILELLISENMHDNCENIIYKWDERLMKHLEMVTLINSDYMDYICDSSSFLL